MAEDLPSDVRVVLTQLFTEGRVALAAGERNTAMATVATAETVATNKLPPGAFRDRLLHGCGRVHRLLDPDGDHGSPGRHRGEPGSGGRGEPLDGGDRLEAATAYLTAMERRVERPDERG